MVAPPASKARLAVLISVLESTVPRETRCRSANSWSAAMPDDAANATNDCRASTVAALASLSRLGRRAGEGVNSEAMDVNPQAEIATQAEKVH